LVLHLLASEGFGENTWTDYNWLSFGSGHYPAVSSSPTHDWSSSVLYSQVQLYSSAGKQGFLDRFVMRVSDDPHSYHVSHVVVSPGGPFLTEGFRRHRPETFGATTLINEGTEGLYPYHCATWWSGEGETNWAPIPTSVGATSDITPPISFNPPSGPGLFEAMLFTTLNGPPGSLGTTEQRFGIGILTPEYQGCVVMGDDGSFFQSRTRCIANTTAGLETVSGQILASGKVRLTTELGDGFEAIYHGFGGPAPALSPWIPQIYRRILAGPGVN
jgi:hypothetical protein